MTSIPPGPLKLLMTAARMSPPVPRMPPVPPSIAVSTQSRQVDAVDGPYEASASPPTVWWEKPAMPAKMVAKVRFGSTTRTCLRAAFRLMHGVPASGA